MLIVLIVSWGISGHSPKGSPSCLKFSVLEKVYSLPAICQMNS